MLNVDQKYRNYNRTGEDGIKQLKNLTYMQINCFEQIATKVCNS